MTMAQDHSQNFLFDTVWSCLVLFSPDFSCLILRKQDMYRSSQEKMGGPWWSHPEAREVKKLVLQTLNVSAFTSGCNCLSKSVLRHYHISFVPLKIHSLMCYSNSL